MFRLFISSTNVKNTIIAYMDEKNINYKSFNTKNVEITTIGMTNGKIGANVNTNDSDKYGLNISGTKIVTIIKFCIKNKLTVKFYDIFRATVCLLNNKILQDFGYLYTHKFIDNDKMIRLLVYTCKKLDHEVLDYLLCFKFHIKDIINLVYFICFRKKINVQMIKSLFNYRKYNSCSKKIYELELITCAHIAIFKAKYKVVKLLFKYGFHWSMDQNFVMEAYEQEHIDICKLLVSNGFPFIFKIPALDCIINGDKKMIKEKVNFIYQYFIVKSTLNREPLYPHIASNSVLTNSKYYSIPNISGKDFLVVAFDYALRIAIMAKSLDMVKAIVETGLDLSQTIRLLVDLRVCDDENIFLYLQSVVHK